MLQRDEFIASNPIAVFLERKGIKLRGSTPKLRCNRCPIVEHKPGHLCVEVNIEKQIWYCHDHEKGGSVIDWLMLETGQTADQVLAGDGLQTASIGSRTRFNHPTISRQRPTKENEILAHYDYVDESGRLLYQSVRVLPPFGKDKAFKQRRPGKNGEWIWDMEGQIRVLFNLPAVLNAQEVCTAEGEKDCLTLNHYGYVATTNVGGAGKWLNAYSLCLQDKDILVFGDNDEKGQNHVDQVIQSIKSVALSIKRIQLPGAFKDVTDYLESFLDEKKAKVALKELIKKTAHLLKPPSIYDMNQIEEQYNESLMSEAEHIYDLGRFLPSLGRMIGQPLESGELILLLGDTGIGKSALLQAIARAAKPLPTLFFEMELPMNLLFQRFVQMEINCYASDVVTEYRATPGLTMRYAGLQHICICPEAGLTTAQIETYILKSALKFGKPCAVVCLDYIGLVRSFGKNRYETISNAAEDMKSIAKRTGTIIFVCSQIARPSDREESKEVRLHDARDSGALENSAGLILGVWRPERDRMCIKILKNTKGTSSETLTVKFDGAKMQITELPIQEQIANQM